ncbi:helix-turn-helix transcriptional regulator [uncultured Parasphingorhabdus sp.]|uniref:helix-turn-helix domain-containing protein n=1 Tax=uncultured Parasphingorhabdus sp. TaxID=2709694 RepID=UPI0030DDA29A|tara:strand:+ start:558 stop:911 length:354 start_codon:yes stop_codon:yes gene_type:complete
MPQAPKTLGQMIAEKRKEIGLSQKALAEKIINADTGLPISPQYLNDIEHDRRTPSSDHMLTQIAKILKIEEDYVFFLADRIPARLKKLNPGEEAVHEFVNRAASLAVAFRKQANNNR